LINERKRMLFASCGDLGRGLYLQVTDGGRGTTFAMSPLSSSGHSKSVRGPVRSCLTPPTAKRRDRALTCQPVSLPVKKPRTKNKNAPLTDQLSYSHIFWSRINGLPQCESRLAAITLARLVVQS